MINLTESDVEFEMSRSGGPGGQNVDSRSTAVRARIRIEELPISDTKKEFVREHIPPKNRAGENEIFVENADHRSQHQNKSRALELLNEEINKAIKKGRQQLEKKKRKERLKRKKQGGGGGGTENIKEAKKKQFRQETMDDLLEQAYEEDPDTMEEYVEELEEKDED